MKLASLIYFLIFIFFSGHGAQAADPFSMKKCERSVNQFCLIGLPANSEAFGAKQIETIRAAIIRNPDFPWLDVMDPEQNLINQLGAATGTIKDRKQRENYEVLITALRMHPAGKAPPADVLEVLEIFLKNNPRQSFTFNSPNRDLINQLSELMNGRGAAQKSQVSSADSDDSKCKSMNQAKYNRILSNQSTCVPQIGESEAEMNFFKALAQLVACEEFGIDSIGVIEDGKTRSLNSCPITFKGKISTSIGFGRIEILHGGEITELNWDGNHNITTKAHPVSYWTNLFFPKMNSIVNPKGQVLGTDWKGSKGQTPGGSAPASATGKK